MRAAVNRVHPISGRDNQAALALGFLTETDCTGNLGKNGWLFWLTGFEEIGNTRQTTGDVTGLGAFLRNTGNNITDIHLVSVFNTDYSFGRQEVVSRNISAREGQFLAFAIKQGNRRT